MFCALSRLNIHDFTKTVAACAQPFSAQEVISMSNFFFLQNKIANAKKKLVFLVNQLNLLFTHRSKNIDLQKLRS